jgi:hypothetical protein
VATPLDHDDPIWYQGPPYIAREVVFDEAEMAGCYLTELELLEDRLAKAAKREREFIALPRATEKDMRARANRT